MSLALLIPIVKCDEPLYSVEKFKEYFDNPDIIPIIINANHYSPEEVEAMIKPYNGVHAFNADDTLLKSVLLNTIIEQYNPDYICIMPPGSQPDSGNLIDLLSNFSDEKIMAVTPSIVDSEYQVASIGILFSRGLPKFADVGKPNYIDRANVKREFKGVITECAIFKCSVVKELGGFSLDYHSAYEGLDLCIKGFKAGYKCLHDPSVVIKDNLAKYRYYEGKVILDKDLETFVDTNGGLSYLDTLNDCGEYYDSGPSMPSTELWQHKESSKGKIVCFLADHYGCGHYRIKNPFRVLLQRGWDIMFTTYSPQNFIDWGDILIFQRQCAEHMLKKIQDIRKSGKKVIYDIDDYFHGLENHNPVTPEFAHNPTWLRNIERIIYYSNALTVSTPELAKQYGKFNTNTHIIPNAIDLSMIPKPIKENNDGTIRIGWGGSITHDADIQEVVGAMNHIMGKYDKAVLVFLGADYRKYFKDIPRHKMEWHPGTSDHEDGVLDYYKLLNDARLDIGLAPITNSQFNRSKCLDSSTLITTKRGIIPISEITINDMVLRNQQWKKVIATEHTDIRMGVSITTERGYQLKLTNNHRMMINKEWKEISKANIGDKIYFESEYNEYLKNIPYIYKPWPADSRMNKAGLRAHGRSKNGNLLVTRIINNEHHFITAEEAPRVKISERYGRLMGAAAGDGCFNSKTTFGISCDGQDQDWIESLMKDFVSIGLNPSTEIVKTYGGKLLRKRSVRVHSSHFNRFLISLGVGRREGNGIKRNFEIPKVIWESPLSVQKEWLKGYFETDGCIKKDGGYVEVCSKSEKLIRDTQRLLLNFGIISRVFKTFNKAQTGPKRPYWKCGLNRAAMDIFAERIGFCSKRKTDLLESWYLRSHSNAYKPMQWIQEITNIEPCIVNPIDLQVEDESFTAAGFISHNSDLKSVEYGAWGIATVASNVEPYVLYMKDKPQYGKKGFLAKTEKDWIRHIENLIEDKDLRYEVSCNAQKYVWNERNADKSADIMERICQNLMDDEGHVPKKIEPSFSLPVSFINGMTAAKAEDLQIEFNKKKAEKELLSKSKEMAV